MPSRHLRLDLPAATVPERVRIAFEGLRAQMSIPLDLADLDSKDPHKGVVVDAPAVRGTAISSGGPLPLGESVAVRVAEVSIEDRVVRFSYEEQ